MQTASRNKVERKEAKYKNGWRYYRNTLVIDGAKGLRSLVTHHGVLLRVL
jgi:hypothetical protein